MYAHISMHCCYTYTIKVSITDSLIHYLTPDAIQKHLELCVAKTNVLKSYGDQGSQAGQSKKVSEQH